MEQNEIVQKNKKKKLDKHKLRLIILCLIIILSGVAIIWGSQSIGVINDIETIGPGDFPDPDPYTALA